MKGKAMHKQRGITISGFLLWSIVLFVGALFGFKVGPSYFEYFTIKKQLQAIVNDRNSPSVTRQDIERAFDNRAAIEDIRAINAKDLEITKDGDRIVVSASYSVCKPLAGNMSVCMEFNPSSDR